MRFFFKKTLLIKFNNILFIFLSIAFLKEKYKTLLITHFFFKFVNKEDITK